MNKYIVLYTLELEAGPPDDTVDHWEAFDDYEDAKSRYDQLIKSDDIYTASIALPILSTDYETNVYTHDTVVRAFEEYQDVLRNCESVDDLEEIQNEFGGTDLPPQEEDLIRTFASIDATRAVGRG